MQTDQALALLGGLTPAAFMRRHWQKKPLLVRQALPGGAGPVTRAELFALAARDDVESRLVQHDARRGWRLRQGPFVRRSLPPLAQPGWTLLVQGLDLHLPAARELLSRFRFVPDARLDDVMVSYASDGGGVGAHVDSYDVFLLQVSGARRWRIARTRRPQLLEGVPLKILAAFEPEEEWLLEPGDMLYLPPGWGHDGAAEGGDCMTCSIGFRAPERGALGRELLQRLAEREAGGALALYRDPGQAATSAPARIPEALAGFAGDALQRLLADTDALACALGETLSEPKPQVWFEPRDETPALSNGVVLDRRTRMLYDERHVFINGESFRAGGRDAQLMQRLADARALDARGVRQLTAGARALLDDWLADGWLQPAPI